MYRSIKPMKKQCGVCYAKGHAGVDAWRARMVGGVVVLGAATLLLVAWAHCDVRAEGFDIRESIPWSEKAKPREPDRMVAVWTHTILNRPGRPGVRGFGGRVMFYERRSDEPIKVEGELMVFTFDDTNRDGTNCTPDRKYVFTEEQMPEHYSKSKIGHSYSVWIPWDGVGGVQRKISLVARFESKEGNVVTSQINTQILPGIVPPPTAANMTAPAQTGVQAASHLAPMNTVAPGVNVPQVGGIPLVPAARDRMTTSTIEIAPGIMTPTPPVSVHDHTAAAPTATAMPAQQSPRNWQPQARWQAPPPWQPPSGFQPQNSYQPQNGWQPPTGYQPPPAWQPQPNGAYVPTGPTQAPAAVAPQAMAQPMVPQMMVQAPMHPVQAVPQPMMSQPVVQNTARSGPLEFRVQGVPAAPPRPVGAPMRPRHAGWQSGQSPTPQLAPGVPYQGSATSAAPMSTQPLR